MLAFNASHRRMLVWTLVVGAHVLVVLVLSREREPSRRADEPRDNEALLLIELRTPLEVDEPSPPMPVRMTLVRRRESARPPTPSPQSHAAPPSGEEPKVDWRSAAEQAARHALSGLNATPPRGFDQTPVSPYRTCQKKKRRGEWRPEQKAGFAGGLPFVRVSKHCIVGLPFFACVIGALPPDKSDLFDDMDTDNRIESSVPGREDCVDAAVQGTAPPD